MSLKSIVLDTKRDEILSLVRKHKGLKAYLFGSVARNEETRSSDIDLLVDFERGSTLFDLMNLQTDLQVLLGVSVDVVSTGGLKARDEHIRREAILL
jgi:predicted nucleotidyltransferase